MQLDLKGVSNIVDLRKIQQVSPRDRTVKPLGPTLSPRTQSPRTQASLKSRGDLFRDVEERDILCLSLQERFKNIRSEDALKECFTGKNYTDQLEWLENAKIYFLEKSEYETYFKAQFGEQPWQQICGLANFFDMLPSEVSRISELENCINKAFVDEWERVKKMLKDTSYLDLSNRNLYSIPKIVFNYKKLSILVLDNNKIRAVPREIGQLTALTELRLNNNQLARFPAEIGQLNELIMLLLNENQLTSVPIEVRQLKKLAILLLSNNQIKSLPGRSQKFETLDYLSLAGNPILEDAEALMEDIGTLFPNLNELYTKEKIDE